GSGASSSPSASWISPSARLRVVRSLARRILCWVSDSAALRATVSSSAFLSPRRGTRRLTRLPRRRQSHSSITGAAGGRTGTSTSRGMLARPGSLRDVVAARRAGAGRSVAPAAPAGRATGAPAVPPAPALPPPPAGADPLAVVQRKASLRAVASAAPVEHLGSGFELVLGQR